MDWRLSTACFSLCLVAGPVLPAAQTSQTPVTQPQAEPLRVTVYPQTLGIAIDEFAGQRVRIPTARIAEMLDSHAFVIESPWRVDVGKGFRDRTLVLLDGGSLRVTQEQLAGSTVVVLGVAKTIAGSRVAPAPAWPAALDAVRMKELEVRAVVIATSVHTAEGTELVQ
jgi:hypothetical protein